MLIQISRYETFQVKKTSPSSLFTVGGFVNCLDALEWQGRGREFGWPSVAIFIIFPFPYQFRLKTRDLLPAINIKAIRTAIQVGKSGRTNEIFIPLFNFLYADGHRMLTLGGMIGTKKDQRKIASSRFARMDYARLTFEDEPYWIKVPVLTRKEHLYLESFMPCPDDWFPVDFELAPEEVAQFRKIYRFFPCYAELLL